MSGEHASPPYVKSQHTPPWQVGLLRAVSAAVTGAVGGLLVGLNMGSRDWDALLIGALIGACTSFLQRNGEGWWDQISSERAPHSATVREVERRQD